MKNRVFPPQDGSTGVLSAQFEVRGLTLVTLLGLQEGDCVGIEMKVLDGCETNEWIPYQNGGCCQKCVSCLNQFYLAVPGMYRLTFGNCDDNDTTDPTWWENAKAFVEPVVSSQDILTHFNEGECDMGCCSGSSVSPVTVIPDGAGAGWNIVMSDGTMLPIELIAGTNVTITGNTISAAGGGAATVTTDVVLNADGTATITDAAGDSVTVLDGAVCQCMTLVANADGTYTVSNGTNVGTFGAPTTQTDVVANADGTYTIDDGTDSVNVRDAADCDCIDMTTNADGSVTITNGTSTVTPIDTAGTVTTATATGTDTCGRDYEIGDCLITFPDGTVFSYPAPDTTASVLVNPTGIINTDGDIEGTVDTDDGTGKIYAVVTTDATTFPTDAQIIAGQDQTGAAAPNDCIVSPGSGTASPFDFGAPVGTDDCYISYVEVDPAGNISNVVTSALVAKPVSADATFRDPACWNPNGWTVNGDPITSFSQNVGAAGFDNVQLNNQTAGCRIPLDDPNSDITFGWRVPTIPDTLSDRMRITVRFFDQQAPGGSQVGPDLRLVSSTFVPTAGQTFTETVTPPAGATHWYWQILNIDAHNGNPDVFTVDNITFSNP